MRAFSRIAGGLVAVLSAAYYLFNRYPGPAFIDSGELALCSETLGVPHPTGYPLYIALSRPATLFFERPITAVTILSALIAALAVLVFFHLIREIRDQLFPGRGKSNLIISIAALVFCLTPVVAAQGTTNEVYGLSLLLNLLVIYAAIKTLFSHDPETRRSYLILAWYLTGLSLCNHLVGIQLLPGILLLTGFHFRRRFEIQTLLLILPAFLVPLTMYMILPLRAMADPLPAANWGDLTSWGNFFRHISGWQYNIWMFTGDIAEIWKNLKNFLTFIYLQYPSILIICLPVGLYCLYLRSIKTLAIIALTVLTNIILGINYSIPDIEGYFLLTIALLYLVSMVGFVYLLSFTLKRWVLPIAMTVLLAWQAISVHAENWKGDYTLPEDFAVNMGRSTGYKAVVMSGIWDHHGQAYYLQQAEYFRPDLKFIDKELLRRSWYFKLIKNLYPELYMHIADLLPEFLYELRCFEKGDTFDASKLEDSFQMIINRLLTCCGPAYIDYGLSYSPEGDHFFRQQGLLMRVDTVSVSSPLPQPEMVWRGRPLVEYEDWRAGKHVDIIKYFGRR
jgi:hypothetical protein